MLPVWEFGDKFWNWLREIDVGIGKLVAREGCRHCGGPLHRGDYPRKPRAGLLPIAEEAFCSRVSFCCGRRGCRQRATPPSVRFLGRRVYLGVTVVIAGVLARAAATARVLKRVTGIPARTVKRWQDWWRGGFVESRLYAEERGRLMPPLDVAALPESLVERFAIAGRELGEALVHTCAFLAPLTTASVEDGARFVRLG
jgi:hypothetical protein